MNCFLIADYSTDKVHQGTDSATLSAHVRRPLPIIHLKKKKNVYFGFIVHYVLPAVMF